jgi:hypothetical protein
MKAGMGLLTAILAFRSAAVGATALINTPQGQLLASFSFIQVEKDRPCGYSFSLDNLTGIGWDDLEVDVDVTGASGEKMSFRSLEVGRLEAESTASASGACPDDRHEFLVAALKVTLTGGAPRKDEIEARRLVAAFRRSCAALAKATQNKKISDLTVSEARRLRGCGL